jgi:hypothetical protein
MTWSRCLSSLGCPELGLGDILALAARHEVPAVELRSVGGEDDLAAYLARAFGTPAELVALVRAQPVRVVALNASLRLVGATDEDRARLAALAPWADALGVRRLRVFDGGSRWGSAERAESEATLRWWRALRRSQGWQVDLMVETHDVLLTAAAITRFAAEVPGVPVLWDAHHTWRKGGEDPVATWRAIRPLVVHVHVKDSLPIPGPRHPFTYVLPGDGEFPIAPLLAALTADAFAGCVSLEWERRWHPGLPPLDEALRTAARRGWW